MTGKSQSRRKTQRELAEADISGLSHEGRGIAHLDGQTIFIHGALPGERVRFRYLRRRRGISEGELLEVLQASPERITPPCPHFGVCGGCDLQHLPPQRQLQLKEDTLRMQLQRIGRVEPEAWLPPLTGESWSYRRKARLAVKLVPKKGGVLVGFRERNSSLVAALDSCAVLDPRIGQRLRELAAMLGTLAIVRHLPQIEVAIGDDTAGLVFRHVVPMPAEDEAKLVAFGQQFGFSIYVQPGGPDTVRLLWPAQAKLSYRLPEFELEIAFQPTDFTQINADINRLMVSRAVELLDPQPTDAVLDLFCGLGNFTLPLARRAARVIGVEGEAGLVGRARENAVSNGLENCEFHVANLARDVRDLPWMRDRYDKLLLDPARAGAAELIPQLKALRVSRLAYVSCNPATLARDAGMLVQEQGYRLRSAGIIDMFPQTAHVESIAVFEKA
jgi:23S rRNA (uracil1939-C5)-methyltransferase